MLTPSWLTVLMMQFWTYFWRFRQCQLNFMPFASTLHAAVAFSRATLSALDIFAASAGVGMNAMPLTSTVAIMPANEDCIVVSGEATTPKTLPKTSSICWALASAKADT